MGEIVLKGAGRPVALVDDADMGLLSRYVWYAGVPKPGRVYAMAYVGTHKRTEKRVRIKMSRLLMDAPAGMMVDHINRNTLDNRRANLRVCTASVNCQNRELRPNQTGFYGVCKSIRNKRTKYRHTKRGLETGSVSFYVNRYVLYEGRLRHEGKMHRTKKFSDPEKAARARDEMVKRIGSASPLNFPEYM